MTAVAVLFDASSTYDLKADFRTVLASSGIPFFSARVVGVPCQPTVAAGRLDSAAGLRLIDNARHWIVLGEQIEQEAGISLASVIPPTAEERRFGAIFDAYRRLARDRRRWSNIALARAVSGDLEGGASMLEHAAAFDDLHGRHDAAKMQSDAAAIRIQQFETTQNVRFALKALVLADKAISGDPRLAEARFNRALALEEIGLGEAAAASYARALQNESSPEWSDETSARIQEFSQPTRAALWSRARSRLQRISALDGTFVSHIVRTLPRQTRTAGEEEYLGRWAVAVENGDVIAAGYYLDLARLIGDSLMRSSGESLLADAVLVIDRSNERRERRALQALVRGHRLYMTAKSRARGDPTATRMFDEAAKQFDIAGSPMSSLARYYARTNAGSVYESYSAMAAIEPHVKESYVALRALVDTEVGTDLAERGDVYEAFNAYTRAEHGFECLGEIEGTARMRSSRAHMLTFMGDPTEAWRLRKIGLAEADRSGDLAVIEDVIGESALDEMFERDDTTALALYGTLLHPSLLYPAHRFRFNMWRSPIKFSDVQTVLASIDGHPLRADVENELNFARAASFWRGQPGEAEALLSKCIEYSRVTGRSLMLPYVLLYRASARETMNHDAAAVADLRSSLSLLEERCGKIGRPDLRDVCTVTADDVFYALADLYWKQNADDRAFALGEERRGFVFMHDTDDSRNIRPLPVAEIAKRLEPGTALVVFTSSRENTFATGIERDRVVVHRIGGLTGRLLEKKRRIIDAVRRRGEGDTLELSRELYDELIAPLDLQPFRISRLVIVADRPLKDFPFALLRDRQSQQFLTEQFELLHAPSASVFVQRTGRRSSSHRPRVALTVGDPAFDAQMYPSLSPLPAARDESKRVGRQYPIAFALTGPRATFGNLAGRIGLADVINIAAHTARNAKEPALSDLILADDGDRGSACSLRQITPLPLKKGSTVVIAGCQTGVSRDWGDLRDFAGAFLAAGADNAVATLWDIDDDTSRDFVLRFHRALSRSHSAAAAVRAAQLSMLYSPNRELRDVRAWAGFQAYALGRQPLTDWASHAP